MGGKLLISQGSPSAGEPEDNQHDLFKNENVDLTTRIDVRVIGKDSSFVVVDVFSTLPFDFGSSSLSPPNWSGWVFLRKEVPIAWGVKQSQHSHRRHLG